MAGGGGGGSDLCTEGTANLATGALWGCSEATASGSPGVSLTFSYSNPNPAVYLALPNNGQVVEQAPYSGPQTTVAGGLSNPQGTAVDSAGDVFIADTNNNQVLEVPAGGGSPVPIDTDVAQPWGVAVDPAGNVYVADADNHRVVELPAGGGPAITIADNLSYPEAVAVDPRGDVFIADSGDNQVIEVPAGSAQPAPIDQEITIASGLNDPAGVAVDTAGDVFIAERALLRGQWQCPEGVPSGTDDHDWRVRRRHGRRPRCGREPVRLRPDRWGGRGPRGRQRADHGDQPGQQPGRRLPWPPHRRRSPPTPRRTWRLRARPTATPTPRRSRTESPQPTFALASGTLPPGLTLDPSTGVLSGAVSATGTWQFVVEAQNAVTASMGPVTTITNAVPAVSTVSPAAGPTAGGGTVTITGTGFAQNSDVAFGSDRGHIRPCPIPWAP